MNPDLVNIAIANIPSVIALIRESFHRAQPNDPQPTDEEMISALEAAVASSIARDDLWLSQHPEDGGAA